MRSELFMNLLYNYNILNISVIFANDMQLYAPVFVRCNHHHYLSRTIFEPKNAQLSTKQILSNTLHTLPYNVICVHER